MVLLSVNLNIFFFSIYLNNVGYPPKVDPSTQKLAICWYQYLKANKEISSEELKQYSVLLAVNELFPSDLSCLEENDLKEKLGISY